MKLKHTLILAAVIVIFSGVAFGLLQRLYFTAQDAGQPQAKAQVLAAAPSIPAKGAYSTTKPVAPNATPSIRFTPVGAKVQTSTGKGKPIPAPYPPPPDS